MSLVIGFELKKNCNLDRVRQLIKSVKNDSVSFVIINSGNSEYEVSKIIDDTCKNEYKIITNAKSVKRSTILNQMIRNAEKKDFLLKVNAEKTLFVNEDWLNVVSRYLKKDLGIAGNLRTLFLNTGDEDLMRCLKFSGDDLDWIDKYITKNNELFEVHEGSFLINIANAQTFGGFSESVAEDYSVISFCFRVLANGYKMYNIPEMYSEDFDRSRRDIYTKIKNKEYIMYTPIDVCNYRKNLI